MIRSVGKLRRLSCMRSVGLVDNDKALIFNSLQISLQISFLSLRSLRNKNALHFAVTGRFERKFGNMSTNVKENVQTSYGKWLGQYDWTYWTTMTTRYELSLPSARRIAEGYYKHLSKAGGCRMFFAVEPFDCRNGYHLHALIKVPDVLPYNFMVNTYQFVCGNKDHSKADWHRIQLMKYNDKRGASYYLGKYITKTLSDYDFLGK